MPTTIKVEKEELEIALTGLSNRVADKSTALKIAGNLMHASIMTTFREEGSPAGSWPALAASTLKKKRYTPGHKLLVLSGRLRNSITYYEDGSDLTIGTNVVYAAVHQYGSADRSGGSIGPQAKIPGRSVRVSSYDYSRLLPIGRSFDRSKRGRKVRIQGPGKKITMPAHDRHQNIPARPFLVFRPEDPGRIASGIDAYLKTGRVPWGAA